jgi:hypothetical protein
MITEYTAATLVLPGCAASVDGLGNLVIDVREDGVGQDGVREGGVREDGVGEDAAGEEERA